MSEFFVYIATESTEDPAVPYGTRDIRFLAQDTSDAFRALEGGYQRVGQLAFFPLQRSVSGHMLCDGKEVPKASFPQLWSYLGDTQGTPADADNFVLPNYVGAAAFEPATVSQTETVNDGTVTAPPPTDPSIPGWDDSIYDQWDSGGKPPWFIPPP